MSGASPCAKSATHHELMPWQQGGAEMAFLAPNDPYGLLCGSDLGALDQLSEQLNKASMGFGRGFDVWGSEGTDADSAPPSAPDTCSRCQGRMHVAHELELVCDTCGYVVENELNEDGDDGPKKAAFSGRLRIVGPNCARYQPDLDRSSNSSNNKAAQIRQVADEYLAYRSRYIERGGRAFPEEACKRAAEYYNEVQQAYVKRSQNKRAIMAAHLYHACHEMGFVPTKAEVAEFMELPKKGTARGENFIRMMASEGQTTVDVNKDPCAAMTATVFLSLGPQGEQFAALQPAVEAIVRRAQNDLIGSSSTLRSKVNGAAFAVIQRYARTNRIKCISQQDFCNRCSIRKNTIEQFTSALSDYHSHFEDIYREFGLDDASSKKGH